MKRRLVSRERRRKRKVLGRAPVTRNPFADENGKATPYLRRLIWRAIFTETFAAFSPTYRRWVDTKEFAKLAELAAVMEDVEDRFKSLDARAQATIFVIQAIRLLHPPHEPGRRRSPFACVKKLALSIWAADQPPVGNETFREKRISLERGVHWDSLRRTLCPGRFTKSRRGRPPRIDDILKREAYLAVKGVAAAAPARATAPLYEMLGLNERPLPAQSFAFQAKFFPFEAMI
jgi:hypothetical protein